jgi:threonine dehydrogenase-like Zn-dependent dehydrogenase
MISCRFCAACLAGRSHLCERRMIYSVRAARRAAVCTAPTRITCGYPNSVVHKVDTLLPPEVAVMFNPLGAASAWAVEIPELAPARAS